MTPPPDTAVAALSEALRANGLIWIAGELAIPDLSSGVLAALHVAGWTLSRRSDLEAAAAAEARVAVLVEALERLVGTKVMRDDRTYWCLECNAQAATVEALPHKEWCAVQQARAALVAGEGEG